jgi:hypothetical protein
MLDVFVSKLNANGEFLSASRTGGLLDDRSLDMVVDPSLQVLVTGYFSGTSDFDPGNGVFNLEAAGQSDVFVLALGQCIPTSSTISPVVCDEYLSPDGTTTWTVSGTYQDTMLNAEGCDSVITVHLTILESSTSETFASGCDEYISPSGKYLWTVSGDYTDTLINTSGCDSILLIHLTMGYTSTATVHLSGCDLIMLPDGTEITTSDTITYVILGSNGCDSITTFIIDIDYSTSAALDVSACDSYTSPGGTQTWTESGVYTDIILNSAGCDSVITINLEIIKVDAGITPGDLTLFATMDGAAYQWIDCGNGNQPIPGETSQQFTPTENGFYGVIVTFKTCVDTSACIPYFIDATSGPGQPGQLKVYPNPARDYIMVEHEEEIPDGRLIITDSYGIEVLTMPWNGNGQQKLEWSIPRGHYTITLISGNDRRMGRVIKTE